MRYLITTATTGRYFQPMRPPFHQWVEFKDVDPKDTFSSMVDASARCETLIPRGSFFIVGYDPVGVAVRPISEQDRIIKRELLVREAISYMDLQAAALPAEERGWFYEDIRSAVNDRLRECWGRHWDNDE